LTGSWKQILQLPLLSWWVQQDWGYILSHHDFLFGGGGGWRISGGGEIFPSFFVLSFVIVLGRKGEEGVSK